MTGAAHDGAATVLGLEHAGRFHGATDCLGGSERVALLALEELGRRGFRVLLACPGTARLAAEATERGIATRPFAFLPLRRTLDVRTLAAYVRSLATLSRDLRRVCRDENVDVIHAFSVISALYALPAVVRARTVLVVHVQDAQPPRPLRRAALRLLSRAATRLICVSHAVEEMLRDIGVPAEKLVLVYNAVDPHFLETAETPAVLPGEGPHVGFFGHIIPWKGHHVFLDAAALLAERFPSARFYLFGARLAGVPQSYVDSLLARVARPPLVGRVELAGGRADVRPLMAAMDVVVHASVAPEAFGLVIAEGMALGKAVVAADRGSPSELVADRETGYLAPAGDARALARVLEHVLENGDPAIGRRAAAASRARFAPEVFGAGLQGVYEDVLRAAERVQAG